MKHSDSDPLENEPVTESSVSDSQASPLPSPDAGYEYVVPGQGVVAAEDSEDDSLTSHLFLHGTTIEKRTLADRVQERREKQAQAKADAEASQAELRARSASADQSVLSDSTSTGIFSRNHHDSDQPELTEEKENSRRSLAWIAGGTAAALLLGAGTFWATGGMHQQPSTLNVATETTGEHSAASPSSSARSAAPTSTPSPTWSAKQPHVTYADPTDLPVAPGTVEYVTEDATPQAIDVAPSHNPADSEISAPQQNAPAPSTPASRVSTDQGNPPTDTGTNPAVEPTVQSTQGQEAESTEQPATTPEALPTTPAPSSPDPVTPETPPAQNIPHATVPAAPATVPHEATAQTVPGSVPTAP